MDATETHAADHLANIIEAEKEFSAAQLALAELDKMLKLPIPARSDLIGHVQTARAHQLRGLQFISGVIKPGTMNASH